MLESTMFSLHSKNKRSIPEDIISLVYNNIIGFTVEINNQRPYIMKRDGKNEAKVCLKEERNASGDNAFCFLFDVKNITQPEANELQRRINNIIINATNIADLYCFDKEPNVF
ncbi:hypothetical protein [Buttiauxella sp. S19-1]|uniref:hypothetical protein n=1 Tax=Buttiauxella sp. S19-1 TaxID=941430 RepID=UPI001EDC231B|nr:hypothetical protein [Buttiauxella sp. S19-1]